MPKRAKTSKVTKPRRRRQRSRGNEVQKFEELCELQSNLIGESALQILEILETYTKYHLLSCEPAVLRELLRASLKFIPKGVVHTKLRGILAFFTRNPSVKTFMKLAQILEGVAKAEGESTFVEDKEVPFDRIVDQTTIIRMSGRQISHFELIDAKINRLKIAKPQRQALSSQSLPDSEPPFWANRNN